VKGLSDEITRATGVESGLNTRLTAAEGAIASLNAATTLEGVGPIASRPEAGKVAGAIWIATDNNKEYVWDGSKWVELGDTTAELTEINSLKERATALETSLAEGGDTAKAIAAAKTQADKGVADAAIAKGAADAAQGDATSALEKLAVVQGSGEGSITKALTDAESYTDGKIATVNEAISGLTSTVETNKTEAAAATKQVADDLVAYIGTNNSALADVKATAEAATTVSEVDG
jgi:ribosomal protein L10